MVLEVANPGIIRTPLVYLGAIALGLLGLLALQGFCASLAVSNCN
jgi:hypothetical protein